MRLKGMTISTARLGAVATATVHKQTAARNGSGDGSRLVSQEVLNETRVRNPRCNCEDEALMASHGLPALCAGTPVAALRDLESGCTRGRWVCPRLDAIRRLYGK